MSLRVRGGEKNLFAAPCSQEPRSRERGNHGGKPFARTEH